MDRREMRRERINITKRTETRYVLWESSQSSFSQFLDFLDSSLGGGEEKSQGERSQSNRPST